MPGWLRVGGRPPEGGDRWVREGEELGGNIIGLCGEGGLVPSCGQCSRRFV